ncbi:MAG: putative DNA binding domain-containing protein [Vicingaceae bacterium]|nr:putative DNA binding domain-containing protein [Vicingaceae bacterium]
MINLINTISAGESSIVEFKTNFCNEAIETIVAFANAKGGKVLIGVSNDGAIVGTTLNEETVQNWINEIKQKTAPTLIPDVDIFRSMGLIEKYGSGILRIINYFKEAKLPKPTFKNQSNGFVVTVFAKNKNLTTQNVPENVPKNVPKKRLHLIVQLIKKDTHVSMLELSKKIGVTHKTIKRDIEKLKTQGVLKRIGPAKGGYWKISEINNYINKIEDDK